MILKLWNSHVGDTSHTNSDGKECSFLDHCINHDHFYGKFCNGCWDMPPRYPFRKEESIFPAVGSAAGRWSQPSAPLGTDPAEGSCLIQGYTPFPCGCIQCPISAGVYRSSPLIPTQNNSKGPSQLQSCLWSWLKSPMGLLLPLSSPASISSPPQELI